MNTTRILVLAFLITMLILRVTATGTSPAASEKEDSANISNPPVDLVEANPEGTKDSLAQKRKNHYAILLSNPLKYYRMSLRETSMPTLTKAVRNCVKKLYRERSVFILLIVFYRRQ